MSTIIAIIIFSLIILIHEFGHFLLAKLNGVTVNEFSLGMGPKLFSFEKGGTLYCLKALPFGGSCMMEGEDESSDNEGAFFNKPVWARISVVFAGPFFNFILAFILSVIITAWVGYDPPVLGDIMEGFPAQAAGIEPGDTILSLNGTKMDVYREISMYLQMHAGEDVTVVYRHAGEKEQHKVTLTPQMDENGRYYIGIVSGGYKKAGILRSLQYGLIEVKYYIRLTLMSLRMLFSGQLGVQDMSGPVGIVSYIGDTYQVVRPSGFLVVLLNMMEIATLLSANLGVMNLLPIPALDGGRLLMLLAEAVTKKRIPVEKEGMINLIGFALLMALMVFVLFNDIRNLFF